MSVFTGHYASASLVAQTNGIGTRRLIRRRDYPTSTTTCAEAAARPPPPFGSGEVYTRAQLSSRRSASEAGLGTEWLASCATIFGSAPEAFADTAAHTGHCGTLRAHPFASVAPAVRKACRQASCVPAVLLSALNEAEKPLRSLMFQQWERRK